MYLVIGLLPLFGAAHDTVAEPLPAVAVTPIGAAGAVGVVDGFSPTMLATDGVPLVVEDEQHVVPGRGDRPQTTAS